MGAKRNNNNYIREYSMININGLESNFNEIFFCNRKHLVSGISFLDGSSYTAVSFFREIAIVRYLYVAVGALLQDLANLSYVVTEIIDFILWFTYLGIDGMDNPVCMMGWE